MSGKLFAAFLLFGYHTLPNKRSINARRNVFFCGLLSGSLLRFPQVRGLTGLESRGKMLGR